MNRRETTVFDSQDDIDKYYKLIWWLVNKNRAIQPQDRNDLVHDVIVKLASKKKKINTSYIQKIVFGTYIDGRRRLKRDNDAKAEYKAALDWKKNSVNQDHNMFDLEQLPTTQRELDFLVKYYGEGPSAIGKECGRTKGSIKSSKRWALGKIKDRIGELDV